MKTPLFLLVIVLFASTPFQSKRFAPKYKLLLYVTLNNSTELQKKDTTWLYSKNCLELKIDSIDMNSLMKFENKEQRFYYKNQVFLNTQLFDTKMYDALKKISITGFNVSVSAHSEPRGIFAWANCLTNEQRKFAIGYWKDHKTRDLQNENFFVSFDDIRISNTFGKKSIFGESIVVGVVCYVK